jgi:hypothetical protein
MKGQLKLYGATINVIHEDEETPREELENQVKNCITCNVPALLLLFVVTIVIAVSSTSSDHQIVKHLEKKLESHSQHVDDHDENSALFYDEQIIDPFSEDGVGLKASKSK